VSRHDVSRWSQSSAAESGAGGEEAQVLAMLSRDEPRDIESLIGQAGLPPSLVARALTALEMGGLARPLEGQRWIAVRQRGGR
jgi:hypothetical protein